MIGWPQWIAFFVFMLIGLHTFDLVTSRSFLSVSSSGLKPELGLVNRIGFEPSRKKTFIPWHYRLLLWPC